MNSDFLIDALESSVRDQLALLVQWSAAPAVELARRQPHGGWSALEVMEHLNISSGHYTRRLQRAYAMGKGFKRLPKFGPGRWGERFTMAMRPLPDGTIPKPMKTLWFFEPKAAEAKGRASMDELRAMLGLQLELLARARTMGLEGPRITSTLGPLFRFKPGDAFRFMVAHQERHFLQIAKLLSAPDNSGA